MPKHHRRRILRLVSAVILAAASCALTPACGDAGGSGASSPTSSSAGPTVLRLASFANVSTWNPNAATSAETMFLCNMYEPLLYANPPEAAEPFTPCLATSWEVSDDGLTWTFHLRQGVRFHDGTPFDSAAVKYSIESTLESDQGNAYVWYPVKKIATPDDYTVEITTKYPAAIDRVASGQYAAWMISPATKGRTEKWWNAPHEAGTGPYTLVSYRPNEEVVFKRDRDYWGGWQAGQFDQVVVKQVVESTTQRQMLEAGEVDFADGLSYDSVAGLKKNPDVRIIAMPSVWNIMLMLNTQRPYLDDVRIRQAISYAIDYQDVLTVGSHGYAQQSAGPLPRNVYPHDPELQPYPHDLDKAKQLMAEAGYPDGGFELLMTIQSDEQWAPKFAPLIKEALGRIGIDVTIQPMLFTQLWEKAKGRPAQRQDIMELLWWPGFPDGYDTLYSCFHTESEPYWNLAYWYDETYDRLIDSAFRLEATDPEEAQRLYNKAQRMLVDQAPAVYLFDPQAIFGVLESLRLDDGALNPWYTAAFFWYRTSR